MNKLQKNTLIVLSRIEKLVKEDSGFAEHLAYDLECFLDEALMDDCFGTEGQNDPRGDMRIKDWTLAGNGDIQE